MKIQEKDKQATWVVAVSGGADSMALLGMCIAQNMDIIVAHMNYQKRESAKRDMEGVQAYCKLHQIPCVIRMQDQLCQGNFQAFAREQRYAFFREIMQRHACVGVLVAHHLDDHLETYLMQQQRGSISTYYGIQERTNIFDCLVVRPLLSYTKQALEDYCKFHCIPYFLDESNVSDAYTRNRIRHEVIDHMTYEDKLYLAEEIDRKNVEATTLQKQVQTFLSNWDHSTDMLVELPLSLYYMVIEEWVFLKCHIHISRKECDTIYKLLKEKANNWTRTITVTYDMYMEYGYLHIVDTIPIQYTYTYDHIVYETTPFFTCARQGTSIEAVTITDYDLPITIRAAQEGDTIELCYGRKKLNRWFIDRKISKKERKIWPVVVNAQGKIILVPKIGCDISHFSNNPNLFVIK